MTTAMRRAWRHVKYTSHDLRSARERAERHNARVKEWQELDQELKRSGTRHRLLSYREPGSDIIVDPDLAEPSYPRWHDRDYGWKGRYIIGTIAVVLVLVVAVLTFGIRGLVHNIEHRECPRKAAAMDVEAQWTDYSFFGWECLANIDGRWVPIDTVHNDTGIWIRGGNR